MEESNINSAKNIIRYELHAQNRNGDLIVKNLEENNFFVITLAELFRNKKLLQGFSQKNVDWIESVSIFETNYCA